MEFPVLHPKMLHFAPAPSAPARRGRSATSKLGSVLRNSATRCGFLRGRFACRGFLCGGLARCGFPGSRLACRRFLCSWLARRGFLRGRFLCSWLACRRFLHGRLARGGFLRGRFACRGFFHGRFACRGFLCGWLTRCGFLRGRFACRGFFCGRFLRGRFARCWFFRNSHVGLLPFLVSDSRRDPEYLRMVSRRRFRICLAVLESCSRANATRNFAQKNFCRKKITRKILRRGSGHPGDRTRAFRPSRLRMRARCVIVPSCPCPVMSAAHRTSGCS